MTVAVLGHKASVYRSGAVTDKRDGKRASISLTWTATPDEIGGSDAHQQSCRSYRKTSLEPITAAFREDPLNPHTVAAQTSRFGINLNCLAAVHGTGRYGMFTQWVRSNLTGAC
jgi:hypothetical protein